MAISVRPIDVNMHRFPSISGIQSATMKLMAQIDLALSWYRLSAI
jgi:hypothetical protein